jgi:hypothetical protein
MCGRRQDYKTDRRVISLVQANCDFDNEMQQSARASAFGDSAMRRIFLAAAILLATFFSSSLAQAHGGGHGGFHGGGFHGGGFHGGGFHGGGFGGFGHHGFGGFGNRGFGYGGFGGYRGIGYGGLGYRGLGYGGYRGFGYGYPYYRSYYRPYYGLGLGYGLGYGLGFGLGYGGYGYGYPYYNSYGYGYPYYSSYGYPYYGGYGGYGGYGYPYSAGYGGYGYGYPAYNTGYSPWFGCYNSTPTTGTTVGIGYPTGPTVGTYVPSGSLLVNSSPVVTSVVIGAPAAARSQAVSTTASISASSPPTPAVLQAFLGLKDIHPVSLSPAATPTVTSPTLGTAASTSLQVISAGLISNIGTRTQAERLLKEGDDLFRAQKFASALERYKQAVVTTPDLAEALWRQGHALIATHQYELATRAFKRAIAVTDDLGRGGFRLSDLYGAAAAPTKAEHLESLADWAAKANTADRYFLVGLFLNYDNQAARAQKFFQKASELAGIAGGHVAVFLDEAAEPTASAPLDRRSKPDASPTIEPVSMAREV